MSTCDNIKCKHNQKTASNFLLQREKIQCSRCLSKSYWSEACRLKDWFDGHKFEWDVQVPGSSEDKQSSTNLSLIEVEDDLDKLI